MKKRALNPAALLVFLFFACASSNGPAPYTPAPGVSVLPGGTPAGWRIVFDGTAAQIAGRWEMESDLIWAGADMGLESFYSVVMRSVFLEYTPDTNIVRFGMRMDFSRVLTDAVTFALANAENPDTAALAALLPRELLKDFMWAMLRQYFSVLGWLVIGEQYYVRFSLEETLGNFLEVDTVFIHESGISLKIIPENPIVFGFEAEEAISEIILHRVQ